MRQKSFKIDLLKSIKKYQADFDIFGVSRHDKPDYEKIIWRRGTEQSEITPEGDFDYYRSRVILIFHTKLQQTKVVCIILYGYTIAIYEVYAAYTRYCLYNTGYTYLKHRLYNFPDTFYLFYYIIINIYIIIYTARNDTLIDDYHREILDSFRYRFIGTISYRNS